ncbi:hypothetical protein BUALT_Bualt18G0094200 [Buddleja alternifolia]|uniref:HMA domain-containing protein n=1 Tax=Buddleja alternifolia TaxID=168488 RepID=A0AAV6W9Y0_9LAMI|nr:hypothetical protein BUALT_Bualt18G0094200 [Buddleja alternifolia]
MAVEKETKMVLKVDLQCSSCYKKVKKTRRKFPQIRDQVYDDKANTVTITVFCCSPEKIRDKLCCKGGKTIKNIEIKKPKPEENAPKKEEDKKSEKGPEPVLYCLLIYNGYYWPIYDGYYGPIYDGYNVGPYYYSTPPTPQPCYDGIIQETVMVLKVDLQCSCCYKKVKKTLCKFPQIRDQVYDEKANTVTITVFCCSPEKIRDKLCSKGGKTIKSIEIKEPKKPEKPKEAEKPKQPEKPKEAEKPKQPEKPKEAEKPKQPEKPKEAEKPKQPEKPKEAEKPKSSGAPPAEKPAEKPKEAPKPDAAKPAVQPAKGPEPVPVGVPSVFPYCGPSYDGYNAGPYYYGTPAQPQPCYEGYYGYGHGYGRGGQVSRCDTYFCEENPQGCSIM